MTTQDFFFYTDDFMYETMGIKELPSVVYHYTSVESLRKILETCTLRFSRLDRLNDPEEAMASDLPLAPSLMFVSCWSSDEAESIPMWSMYGDNFCGVRIGLPINMFAGRRMPQVLKKGGAQFSFEGNCWSITRSKPAMDAAGYSVIGPNKVFYTDEGSFRDIRVIYRLEGRAHVFPYDLGMVKSSHWSFEQEWRFKISAISEQSSYPDDRYFNEVMINLEKFPVTTECLFIPLDSSILNQIEVVTGPKANQDAIKEVEDILKAHANQATLVRSEIPMR